MDKIGKYGNDNFPQFVGVALAAWLLAAGFMVGGTVGEGLREFSELKKAEARAELKGYKSGFGDTQYSTGAIQYPEAVTEYKKRVIE